MLHRLGDKLTQLFLKFMPHAFVFALLLTITTAITAYFWLGKSPIEIISAWYNGFFDLLGFAMQIILMIITGLSIALSPLVKRGIDWLTRYVKTPTQVYLLTVFIGSLLSLVSFGWVVVASVLARELALRIKNINYPFLIACVYLSMNSWVFGLSSSIPLLLNSDKNYLIENGVLENTIGTSYTLGSSLNIVMIVLFTIGAPILMILLGPKKSTNKELSDFIVTKKIDKTQSIKEEALSLKLPFKSISDKLNNSILLQMIIALMGLSYIIYHFSTKGLDLNFNIMIFIFLIVGMFLHKTPIRYAISMKRSSSNISGILLQYPFYAGIMGIMLYTGLGAKLGEVLASVATINNYPFYAYITGGIVNFAIPSAGGEFAVVGPSIINAVNEISVGLPAEQITAMTSRAAMSVAYGESLSNLLQPFFLLIVLPIMAGGTKIQERDIMGYLVIPFMFFLAMQLLLVLYWPL